MGITEHTHGNLNDIRGYPFVDTATRRDANGKIMPESVLNDCHLWWPHAYGEMGFVSTVTVSPALVTMTFAAYNAGTGEITAIAVLQVDRAYTPYRSYELQALQPGVGGWAAVGRVPEELTGLTTWTFDDPSNAELLERVAEFYEVYPVSSLGKKDVPIELTGDVRFLAGSNLTIEEGYRYVDNELVRCVVFALDGEQLPALYSHFVGPCGKRPESDTCDVPAIRRINAVEPDASGRIYLEVDNANSVLDATLDAPDVDEEGVVLITPIDYDDICTPIEQPEILPHDECESSLAPPPPPPPPPESSWAGNGAGDGGSSSIGMQEASFDFGDVNALADFSLFKEASHLIDWEIPNDEGDDLDFLHQDDTVVVPFRRYASETYAAAHHIRCNSHDFHLQRVGDMAEIELHYLMKAHEILALSNSLLHKEGRQLLFTFSSEHIAAWPEFSMEGIRLVVKYRNITPIAGSPRISVSIHAEIAKDNGWEQIPGTDGSVTYSGSENSSSSHSDGGAAEGTYHETIRFRIELLSSHRFEPYDSSSSGIPQTHWQLEIDYNNGVYESGPVQFLTGRDPELLRFFNLGFDAHATVIEGLVVGDVNAYLKWVRFRATGLSRSHCDEENFLKYHADQRVPYKLKYSGPSEDWSNDFGTRRALQQVDFLPAGENTMVPQLFGVTAANKIVYDNQLLDAPGSQHQYAVLRCEESIAGDLIMSVAFKYISGNPRLGIVIGWQNTARHDFWALAVNIKSMPYVRMGYGHHFIPHLFRADWVDIMTPPADWLTSWHRLVVRVIGASAPYNIAGWIDPGEAKTGISSSGNFLLKAIPVDYADPTIAFTNKGEWDGSSVSYGQFADGGTGIYVYGGAVRLAEFTVSTTDGEPPNIVVPNKCPWLDL